MQGAHEMSLTLCTISRIKRKLPAKGSLRGKETPSRIHFMVQLAATTASPSS